MPSDWSVVDLTSNTPQATIDSMKQQNPRFAEYFDRVKDSHYTKLIGIEPNPKGAIVFVTRETAMFSLQQYVNAYKQAYEDAGFTLLSEDKFKLHGYSLPNSVKLQFELSLDASEGETTVSVLETFVFVDHSEGPVLRYIYTIGTACSSEDSAKYPPVFETIFHSLWFTD